MDVFPTVHAGETERQVHARLTARAIELGADSIHGILQSSANAVLYGGESDKRLDDGCIVRTDCVVYLDGYAANLSRPLHIGLPSSSTERRYESNVEICHKAVAMLRPRRQLRAGAPSDPGSLRFSRVAPWPSNHRSRRRPLVPPAGTAAR